MRLRNWIIIEVTAGITLAVIGTMIHNDLLSTLGISGTMLPLFHNFFGYLYEADKLKKELKKDNKYLRGILCSNCQEYNWFRIPLGKCIPDFLSDKQCKYCNCKLKEIEIIK